MKREMQVEIKGKVLLKGTLTIPNNEQKLAPAILLIPGSGPGDRDGNIKKAKMNLNIYKLLAEQLTAAGYVTLRFDKRGVGESEGKFETAGMWDFVDDAVSALQFLKRHPNVDEKQVVVLGHSEGVMLTIALNEKEDIAGMILLGGAGVTLEEALKYQRSLAYQEIDQFSGLKGWLTRTLKATEKAEKSATKMFEKMMNTDKDVIRVQLIAKMPAKWFREHFQFDLYGAMSKIHCPVLAITGSMDVQAIPEKVHNVQNFVQGDAESHVIEGMNHILKEQTKQVPISKIVKEYKAQSDVPLHPELIDKINAWLVKHLTDREQIMEE